VIVTSDDFWGQSTLVVNDCQPLAFCLNSMDLAALAAAFGAKLARPNGNGALLTAHEVLFRFMVSGFRAPFPRVGDLTCWGDSIEAED
jgi:hypothetical protein